MIDFACAAAGLPNPFFIAALIKRVEKKVKLLSYLQPYRQGIFKKPNIILSQWYHEFIARGYSEETSFEIIEKDYGIEFCFILESQTSKNNRIQKITRLPSFEKPTVFLLKKRKIRGKW